MNGGKVHAAPIPNGIMVWWDGEAGAGYNVSLYINERKIKYVMIDTDGTLCHSFTNLARLCDEPAAEGCKKTEGTMRYYVEVEALDRTAGKRLWLSERVRCDVIG